jgi:DNA-binding response OmpR family regulator
MNPRQQTVLVVDDDVEFCELIMAVLGEAGFRVFTALDAAEAFLLLSGERPDAAVVDTGLPGRSGFRVLQAIKRMAGPDTPVVMTAAYLAEKERAKLKRLGANDLLVVPYDVEDLVEAVVRLCPPRTA